MIDFAHAHNADPNDLEIQCEFVMHELDTDPKYVAITASALGIVDSHLFRIKNGELRPCE
jgi:hypothetical protein